MEIQVELAINLMEKIQAAENVWKYENKDYGVKCPQGQIEM